MSSEHALDVACQECGRALLRLAEEMNRGA